jgi:hypothetical protein
MVVAEYFVFLFSFRMYGMRGSMSTMSAASAFVRSMPNAHPKSISTYNAKCSELPTPVVLPRSQQPAPHCNPVVPCSRPANVVALPPYKRFAFLRRCMLRGPSDLPGLLGRSTPRACAHHHLGPQSCFGSLKTRGRFSYVYCLSKFVQTRGGPPSRGAKSRCEVPMGREKDADRRDRALHPHRPERGEGLVGQYDADCTSWVE